MGDLKETFSEVRTDEKRISGPFRATYRKLKEWAIHTPADSMENAIIDRDYPLCREPERARELIRSEMKKQGISQQELANKTGVTRRTMISWLKDLESLDAGRANAIAHALGFESAHSLLYGTKNASKETIETLDRKEMADIYAALSEEDRKAVKRHARCLLGSYTPGLCEVDG